MTKIGTYKQEDITFLLKNVDNFTDEVSTSDREKNIQGGQSYFETLPVENAPSADYMKLYDQFLQENKERLAIDIGIACEKIVSKKGENVVLVSLVRGGTPIGILMKRYIEQFYHVEVQHYGVSILRGGGIDENALAYILKSHPDTSIQFVDGWVGKGAITRELGEAINCYNKNHNLNIDSELAVAVDMGYCTTLYGSREDYVIPNALLNSTISGLISRTFKNAKYVGPEDFHGVKTYPNFATYDVSQTFIETVSKEFKNKKNILPILKRSDSDFYTVDWRGYAEIERIQEEFGLPSINLVKPGVCEAARILLRRVPWKILVKDIDHPDLAHIKFLAEEKGIELVEYKNMSYLCCGLIKPIVGVSNAE